MKLPTYLNLDLDAPELQVLLDSVVVDGAGALSLAPVHAKPQQLADAAALALGGPAAIGVAPDGDVYVADTLGDRVLRVPLCGGDGEPVGCLHRMLKAPRGVLAGPREALYVTDSGNDRVLVVDLVTEQLRGEWPGLAEPWDLAADADDRLYVVEHGAKRIVRVDLDGRIDPSFSLAHASTVPRQPESVVTTVHEGDEMLVVLDRVQAGRLRLLAYHLDGVFAERETRRVRHLLRELSATLLGPAAAGDELLYVAEAGTGRVLSFDMSGRFVGSARWHGEVAALALDQQGRLVLGGGTTGIVALDAGHPAAGGGFRIGPIAAPFAPPEGGDWQLVCARLDPLPESAHVQLFAWPTEHESDAPPPLSDAEWLAAPLDAPAWRPPFDARAPYLWLGGRMTSGGSAGPLIRGLRVEFDSAGWLRHLPAIYSRESATFLEPALAALEDALREQEDLIDGLPRLFDPAAAPAANLERLAGWLAYELDESSDEHTRRQMIARAFQLQGMRGTAESLKGTIALVLGIDAQITEPAAHLHVWQLGEDASTGLGFGTTLFAGEPDGAIIGTTAELGHSNLQLDEDFGAAVFGSAAHRFCVRVHGSDLAGDVALAALERLVERERPAETEAHVCVIEPNMRVGVQATLGLDAVVGREGEPMMLGEEGLLGAGAALRDQPARLTVGHATRLGRGRTLI